MKSPGIKAIARVYKPLIHCLALLPFAMLMLRFLRDDLGINPVEAMTQITGEWALRILLITLLITPLARISGSGWMIHFRRLIGLYCFFYAALHFCVYLIFDLSFKFPLLYADILDRPYITVGFAGILILIVLAVTSPLAIRQKLGATWLRIHQLVYLAAILGVVHVFWITRVQKPAPFVYAAILALLLGYRLVRRIRLSRAQSG